MHDPIAGLRYRQRVSGIEGNSHGISGRFVDTRASSKAFRNAQRSIRLPDGIGNAKLRSIGRQYQCESMESAIANVPRARHSRAGLESSISRLFWIPSLRGNDGYFDRLVLKKARVHENSRGNISLCPRLELIQKIPPTPHHFPGVAPGILFDCLSATRWPGLSHKRMS
ncbi:MAG: hypothetical protein LBQ62_04405 [Candidatus Accumulibacter sp.]|nr:hypothetical protein [Accumulibacter sp.]